MVVITRRGGDMTRGTEQVGLWKPGRQECVEEFALWAMRMEWCQWVTAFRYAKHVAWVWSSSKTYQAPRPRATALYQARPCSIRL